MKKLFPVLLVLALSFSDPFAAYAFSGWQQEGTDWYYYRDDHKLVNEWVTENEDTYYIGPDGKMLTGDHLIDGYLYMFAPDGKLYNDIIRTVWQDYRIIFDESGRGTLTAMDQEDALYGSTCVQWMDQTYAIYTEYIRTELLWASYYPELPLKAELMARDWGITDKENGTAMVNSLFSEGVITEDKEVKAWNFSRAMLLCSSMREARWIDMVEYRNMQYAMAPTIQQSFSSWEDFFDNYMAAYRKWDQSVGRGNIDKREAAYNYVKKIMNKNDIVKWVPWDRPLIKYW